MRAFQTRGFSQFCRKNRIAEKDLCSALKKMHMGAVDADLGGDVYKQRIARQGQGKSGGFRTIVLLRLQRLAVFVYGFAKNDRDNIDKNELLQFRTLAKEIFGYDDETLQNLIQTGSIEEICLQD